MSNDWPPAETWMEGWLPDGTHFHVDKDPYSAGGKLRINGVVVHPKSQVTRRRDGGTTIIETERGTLICWRKIGTDHYDEWRAADSEYNVRLLESMPVKPRYVKPSEVRKLEDLDHLEPAELVRLGTTPVSQLDLLRYRLQMDEALEAFARKVTEEIERAQR